MPDQRPLMRRSREDRGQQLVEFEPLPARWHRKRLGFEVLMQSGNDNRPTHLHQTRTPVFGVQRSPVDANRGIASENRAERLGRSCILILH